MINVFEYILYFNVFQKPAGLPLRGHRLCRPFANNVVPSEWSGLAHKLYFMIILRLFMNLRKENGKKWIFRKWDVRFQNDCSKSFFEILTKWLSPTVEIFWEVTGSFFNNVFPSEWSRLAHKRYFMIIRRLFMNIRKENGKKVDFQKMRREAPKWLFKKAFLKF